MRLRHVTARLSINILQLPHLLFREVGFDTPIAAKRADAGVRFFFQPAEGVCATGHVGENSARLWIAAKTLIESFTKATERERIAQNENIHSVPIRRRRSR